MDRSPQMFANKFHLHEDRVAVSCLEERIINKTLAYYTGATHFNTSVYDTSRVVTHRLTQGLQDYGRRWEEADYESNALGWRGVGAVDVNMGE